MRKNSTLPKAVGKKIQKRRKQIGITQEEAAERAGISRAYMGYIEQGRHAPSLEVLQKVAKALKSSMSDFV